TPILGWLFIPTVRHPRGLIILCHGHGDNRCAVLPEARVLYNHGYAALVFDFRHSGVSGGRLSTLGRLEVNDLLAVVSWTQTQPALRRLPIGVFGVSMGGAVSLMATARTPVIRAVI